MKGNRKDKRITSTSNVYHFFITNMCTLSHDWTEEPRLSSKYYVARMSCCAAGADMVEDGGPKIEQHFGVNFFKHLFYYNKLHWSLA